MLLCWSIHFKEAFLTKKIMTDASQLFHEKDYSNTATQNLINKGSLLEVYCAIIFKKAKTLPIAMS